MGRGSNNLNYDDGFKHERENYDIRTSTKNILGANQLEETRTLIDIATGTDAYAQIQGNVYISLRVREYNYNSFTLIDIVSDIHSEVHKWKRNRNSTMPAYHVQFKISDDKVLVIRVNIDAFGMF
jgi:hypothetical protein